jgi:hypothetical protein
MALLVCSGKRRPAPCAGGTGLDPRPEERGIGGGSEDLGKGGCLVGHQS